MIIHNGRPDIRRAAQILKRGGVVAFPTETVYGLGADVFNEKAVCRVFEVKKRPRFDPLIVHVASPNQARLLWSHTPPLAVKLMRRFWPGPLSIVLPKNKHVPDIVTSGLGTVAVRMPDHLMALELIRQTGSPLAAPSANHFGYTSPTSALSVAEDLGGKIDAILDGGPSKIGVESTVIKIENNRVYLLRPGGIPVEAIEEVTGKRVIRKKRGRENESPGQLESHYAPGVPLVLMGGKADVFIKRLKKTKIKWEKEGRRWPAVACISFSGARGAGLFKKEEILSSKGDVYEAASRLFQAMRKLDKMSPVVIVAGPFPDKGIGHAVIDRLTKASGGREGWREFLKQVNVIPTEPKASGGI